MHRTFMALQESLDDVAVRSRAFVTAREGAEVTRQGVRTSPEIAIAVQSGFRRATSGYLGVSFDGPGTDEIRRGERIIRFLDYPRIEMVEPDSPAERAGIQEGDTLLALNGTDVREREISLTKLLVPDRRIVVRVRRDRNARDLRVTVEKAPGYVMSRMVPMPPMTPMSPMAVRVYPGEVLPRRPMPPVGAIAGTAPEMAQSVWIVNEAIGGAKLESINEGLGKALGTKSGVLVLRAAPGTPAYESGLRDGDVILKASGKAVSSVRELRSALVDGDRGEGVKLGVLRERKQREVTLRW
jgi:S1-C subfamily serine protease